MGTPNIVFLKIKIKPQNTPLCYFMKFSHFLTLVTCHCFNSCTNNNNNNNFLLCSAFRQNTMSFHLDWQQGHVWPLLAAFGLFWGHFWARLAFFFTALATQECGGAGGLWAKWAAGNPPPPVCRAWPSSPTPSHSSSGDC